MENYQLPLVVMVLFLPSRPIKTLGHAFAVRFIFFWSNGIAVADLARSLNKAEVALIILHQKLGHIIHKLRHFGGIVTEVFFYWVLHSVTDK
jgi:hypothetical protein